LHPYFKMAQWSFGRKIFGAFTLLGLLVIGLGIVALLSLQLVTKNKEALLSTDVQNVIRASELRRIQESRVSHLRAFLLSRSRTQLKESDRQHRAFTAGLGHLLSSQQSTPTRELLLRIKETEAQYDRLARKAVRSGARTNWLMENVVRPEREELDEQLTTLGKFMRDQLDNSTQQSVETADYGRKAIMALGAAVLIALFGLVWFLRGVLRKESAARAQAEQARDVLHMAEKRAAMLAQTGKTLSESPNPRAALGEVARLAVQWLAHLCLIELTNGAGSLRPAAFATASTERDELLHALHKQLPTGLGTMFGTDRILGSAGPTLRETVEDERLRALGVLSYIALPLRVRGRTLGVMLLVRMKKGEPYGQADSRFAEELSHHAALAMDNARLLQEAEVGLRMREELLATVAHDLKNPLTAIRMNSDLIPREKSPERIQKQAETIRESVQQMERLIHDLLDLTKIESGRIVLDRRPNDAEELITASFKIFASQAAAKAVELIMDAKPGECIVDCDRNRVLQVLSNLIGNAMKFTGKGGRIRVEAQATGEGIRFTVVDNGPGIPPDQLPHVFERYWQSRRTLLGSSGLGLSIARGIVEAHGGRIWAESALHIGSRFFFTLPEARRKAISLPKAA